MGVFLYSLFCCKGLYLSFAQYHTVLITIGLQQIWKSHNVSFPTLFSFFFQNYFATLIPLPCHMNSGINFYKISFWYSHWNCVEFIDQFRGN